MGVLVGSQEQKRRLCQTPGGLGRVGVRSERSDGARGLWVVAVPFVHESRVKKKVRV
jgi:hypothetical protein